MRVFVTGASGFIGSASVDELLAAGHEVEGLARSDASAATLEAKGVRVRRGDLDDLDGIRAGAEAAEAVLHLANKHDFAHPEVSDKAEREAVQSIAEVLAGSDRPFLLAAGVGALAPGRPAVESDRSPWHGPTAPRGGSENLALEFVDKGVHSVSVRFAPTVHGEGDRGFIAVLAEGARRSGVSSYIGDGTTRWPAVARSDAARLVRLAMEQAPAGTVVHAVGEEGIPSLEIAAAIGESLGLPTDSISAEEGIERLGFVGRFFGLDLPTSSARTQELLGWTPTGPSLLDDIRAGFYFRD